MNATCSPGCRGIEIEPGVYGGCSCPEGTLANGHPIPPGFECDCPNHPAPPAEAAEAPRCPDCGETPAEAAERWRKIVVDDPSYDPEGSPTPCEHPKLKPAPAAEAPGGDPERLIDALMTYCERHGRNSPGASTLRARVESALAALRAERDEWKGYHEKRVQELLDVETRYLAVQAERDRLLEVVAAGQQAEILCRRHEKELRERAWAAEAERDRLAKERDEDQAHARICLDELKGWTDRAERAESALSEARADLARTTQSYAECAALNEQNHAEAQREWKRAEAAEAREKALRERVETFANEMAEATRQVRANLAASQDISAVVIGAEIAPLFDGLVSRLRALAASPATTGTEG